MKKLLLLLPVMIYVHSIGQTILPGKVGIGTQTPIADLHIEADDNPYILIRARNYTNGHGAFTTKGGIIFNQENEDKTAAILSAVPPGYHTPGILFTTKAAWNVPGTGTYDWLERMYIHPGGNVGIGTINPAYKLHVDGSGGFTGQIVGNNGFVSGQASAEGLRMAHNAAFLCGYNNEQSARTGYLQFNTGDNISLVAENNNMLLLKTNNSNINLMPNGNVGIGTTSPAYKLDVAGQTHSIRGYVAGISNAEALRMVHHNTYISGWNSTNNLRTGYLQFNSGDNVILDAENGTYLCFRAGNAERMRIKTNGNVGIGTSNPQEYKLAVDGTIGARKVKVTLESWADYVFDSSYQLQPLHQVEKFITTNKHLPDVPSAATVTKEGIDLGDNQAVLLKKIEELTLYIIQQNKEIQEQKNRVDQFAEELKALKEKR